MQAAKHCILRVAVSVALRRPSAISEAAIHAVASSERDVAALRAIGREASHASTSSSCPCAAVWRSEMPGGNPCELIRRLSVMRLLDDSARGEVWVAQIFQLVAPCWPIEYRRLTCDQESATGIARHCQKQVAVFDSSI